jgi:plastocyanin
VTVVAQNIAFDTSTIRLEPVPTTITFENRDAGVQHDIAIYSDSSLADELFDGELVTGPATVDYAVPALPSGEHYFQCNVHPNMNGSVVVSDTGGGGGSPPEPTGPS